ncbi:MAG: response regulator [candidate division Zixibacteria bacterium]|nr:response regulator [candidate division Zixibacteria bacterium]
MKTNGRPRILIVDDEEMILSSLRSFFSFETDYEIITFTSSQEAATYVEKESIDLVISDFLMPELDGIAFLAKVKESQPMATRVLLTGFADKENAIKAINEVSIFQYIEKPWENTRLKLIVENGLERSSLLKRMQEIAAVKMDLIKALI